MEYLPVSEKVLDGNADQVRAVANELAAGIVREMTEKNKLVDFHTNQQFHEWLDDRMDNRNRKVLFQLMAAYLIPVLIGGTVLYAKLDQALKDQAANTTTLYSRGQFVRDQQDFNCRIVAYERSVHGPEAAQELMPCRFDSSDDPRDTRR